LQAELGSGGASTATPLDESVEVVEDPYADDPYAKYYDENDEDDSTAVS
jgi:hypothetical protein